jgi:hypothetical protein
MIFSMIALFSSAISATWVACSGYSGNQEEFYANLNCDGQYCVGNYSLNCIIEGRLPAGRYTMLCTRRGAVCQL